MSGAQRGGGGGGGGGGGEGLASAPDAPPALEVKSPLFSVCPFILGNEFCERLAYYGLQVNLVVFLMTRCGFSVPEANIQVNLWSAGCYVMPLVGGWLSDAVLGRYRTIVAFSFVYAAGMTLCVVATLLPLGGGRVTALFAGLYVVAVGTGGIKPCVSTFGADQFDMSIPQHRKDKESFFNLFYLFINIGSLASSTVLVFIQEGPGPYAWTWGFTIPAVAMVAAIAVFVGGHSRYSHVPTAGSPLARVIKVTWAALRNARGGRARGAAGAASERAPLLSAPLGRRSREGLPPEGREGAGVPALADSARGKPFYAWLDQAMDGPGGFSALQVYEVKLVLRLVPILLTTVVFWAIYAQMGTLFITQGLLMNRSTGGVEVPSAVISTIDTVAIILLVPLYDRAFLPLARRLGLRVTTLRRIGWGNLVSAGTMVAAGLLEARRLQYVAAGRTAPGQPGVADLSIYWQVPQYFLIGLAEVLGSIGQLELFYDQAPNTMRSCCSAIQLLGSALGSTLSGVLLGGMNSATERWGGGAWIPDDLNQGRMDYYFYALAGLMLLNHVWYCVLARGFVLKDVPHRRSGSPAKRAGGSPGGAGGAGRE